jgi:hypothetical protein
MIDLKFKTRQEIANLLNVDRKTFSSMCTKKNLRIPSGRISPKDVSIILKEFLPDNAKIFNEIFEN